VRSTRILKDGVVFSAASALLHLDGELRSPSRVQTCVRWSHCVLSSFGKTQLPGNTSVPRRMRVPRRTRGA